jgi:hypothetical protein
MKPEFESELKYPRFAVALGYIHQQPIPNRLTQERLLLNGCDLACYLICSGLSNIRSSGCMFILPAGRLAEMTGYSLRQSKSSLSRLQKSGHILKRYNDKLGTENQYELGVPITRQPLADRGSKTSLKTVLMKNQMAYLQIPMALLERLPTMSGVELQATIALLQMTYKKPEQRINARSWADRANIANVRDLHAATASMDWIAEVEHVPRAADIRVSMKNPVTGALLSDEGETRDDAEMEAAIAERHAEGKEVPRRYSSAVLTEWIKHFIQVCYEDSNGELLTFCPSCKFKGRPSLAISISRGEYGIFYCHQCAYGRKKHIPHLLEALGIDKKKALDKLEEINGTIKNDH